MSTASVVYAPFSRPRGYPRPPRLRLTQRGRVVLTSLAATPLAIVILVVALSGGQATASLGGSSAFHYLTVGSGQSLWQIAQQLAPAADPREVIAEIRQLNRLESADVFAGQQLAVPARYDR